LFIEVRAGVFIGSYSSKTRDKLWKTIQLEIEEGNAVLVWAVNNDAGYDFDTCGKNRRVPIELDGLKLVQLLSSSD
jgi:CRISPR-associated protein Cas2